MLYVGRKEVEVYIIRGLRQFDKNESVIIKARGSLIPKAIYISDEISRIIKGMHYHVNVGTEEVNEDRVSFIEINLSKFAFIR